MKPGNLDTIDLFGIEEINALMVAIPGGKVQMRDDRIKEEWGAEIEPFFLAKFPVTQSLYFWIMKESPSTFEGEHRPVETVSWNDAVVFCNILSEKTGLKPCYTTDRGKVTFNPNENGYRLPTEVEWQYACQAGSTGIRYGELAEIAWYKGNSGVGTREVGKKLPNKWGLYDMLGNVWEWCSDIYDENIYGSYRIFRGGGWFDEERSVMASNRRRSHPTSFKIDDLGFRIARNS